MEEILDKIDRQILIELQRDAGLSVDALSEKVHLSRNACWRRVKQLEKAGVIKQRVVLLDAVKIGCGLSVFVFVRTNLHDPNWLEKFSTTVRTMPEITGAHRMSGDLDYVLRVRVTDVAAYDNFYQRLITRLPLSDVSASFVMEDIKDTTALPL